jgi:hypothetical protein
MTQAIILYVPWLLSAISLYHMFLAGNIHRYTWLVALTNQAFWLIWIVVSANWGLLPLNIGMWIVCTRNHFKWRRLQHGN